MLASGSLSPVAGGPLSWVGAAVCLWLLVRLGWRTLAGLRVHVLSRLWNQDLSVYGEWAVVTGATSGIGSAYAHELARRGLNVVLISRSLEKLKRTATEIESQHGRETRIIQADFTSGVGIYSHISAELGNINVGVLVNNVGMGYQTAPVMFLDVPDTTKAITDILNCNVLSVAMMTSCILPRMLERRKGVIINISSEAATHPHAFFTMYSATKVFVDYFSGALQSEYKSQGIIVQCVNPLLVSTNMTCQMKANAFVKRADDFAREALNTVGQSKHTNGCLSHALQHCLLEVLIPGWLRESQWNLRRMTVFAAELSGIRDTWLNKKHT